MQMIKALNATGQHTLAMHYNHKRAYDNLLWQDERNRLVEEITQEVLSRISATVYVSDIVDKIKELDDAINSLGGK